MKIICSRCSHNSKKSKDKLLAGFSYINKLFELGGTKFSSFTTCGYAPIKNFQWRQHHEYYQKRILLFFFNDGLNTATRIPHDRTCYHTFGSSLFQHNTCYPIVSDGETVCLNDESINFLLGVMENQKRDCL